MASVLLFTEESEPRFAFDDWFDNRLGSLPMKIADEIMFQIINNADKLPIKEHYTQTVCGVVKGDDPYFFELEYINEENYMPVFVGIEEIDLEEYLDSITKNQYFKDEHTEIKESARTETDC